VSSEKAGANPKPRKPKAKPKTKDRSISKAAERNYRVHALLGLAVKEGYGAHDLMTVATKGFKVSPAVAARLVADARLARQALGWQPRHSDLHTLMAHAWQWEQTRAARASNAPCVQRRSPAEPGPYTVR
jgi:hypothetical protein